MISKKYYIYKYLNKDNEVIYVGLTTRPIKQRVKEHEVEKLQEETYFIEYAEVATKADMQMYEIYYINKYKPKYNIRSLDKNGTNMNLPELVFIPFNKKGKEIDIKHSNNGEYRKYNITTNTGSIEVKILNPYSRKEEDKKVLISTKGELICSSKNIKDIINIFIQSLNDISEDERYDLNQL